MAETPPVATDSGAMLGSEEIKRRLDAARTLRGLKQSELAEMVAADGLGKHDVGRLERGDIPLTRALRDSLVRHLHVPDAWFTEETLDLAPVTHGQSLDERVDRMEERLSEHAAHVEGLLERQSRVLARIEELVLTLPSDEQTQELIRALEEDDQPGERAQIEAARVDRARPSRRKANGG